MDKKIFLVAGASSGMGKETAFHLAESGHHVILAARRAVECEIAAEQIRSAGGSADALTFDGRSSDSVEALGAQILDSHGRLDGAFNNIGCTIGDNALHSIPDEQWCETIDVNLTSVFRLMKMEARIMLGCLQGRIVNNSSTGGVRGTKSLSDYSAAKWGLIGLTRSASLDYAEFGLVINVIAPGIISTENCLDTESRMPELFHELKNNIPVKRFGEMAEVAKLVTWLLCDAPSYLNGAVIPVDGARTA